MDFGTRVLKYWVLGPSGTLNIAAGPCLAEWALRRFLVLRISSMSHISVFIEDPGPLGLLAIDVYIYIYIRSETCVYICIYVYMSISMSVSVYMSMFTYMRTS